ncbi:digestive cysteine proteinase 3-like [Choristoneura fumiferana]|uniref:digestive cysteine proteinase 3-like n=1 Tax=Choristoneura fumiferana TaxID=7141 RepID=UPI003D15C551
MFYSHGVLYSSNCDNNFLDHAVLLVGYGILDGEKYWLIKNSWGAGWGADGYVLMSTKDNNCGVESDAKYVKLQ